jgi:hypothetical protein
LGSELRSFEDKKILLSALVATLELQGNDKIKTDLKVIEDSLNRTLEKFEKVAVLEGQVQAQPYKFIPEDSNGKYYEDSEKCTFN